MSVKNDAELIRKICETIAAMPIQEVLAELESLTPEQVATKLQLAETTIYHMAQRGDLPGYKLGPKTVRIRSRALLALMMIKEAA